MKQTYELIAPCHFGLEAVLKKEILDLGYEISQVEDGRVTFIGDDEAICRANVFLRTAERILLKAGSFRAETFEELFQGTKAIAWEEFIPEDGKFWVAKASSIKSKLFSPSDIQRIMKKAIARRLQEAYDLGQQPLSETGSEYPLRVFFFKDQVTVGIDTSGDSLHKRGYRTLTSKAPITETLAAALILLTPWKKDRILVDPFCGSGTFPIEMLPQVYQNIYIFFPFPYAINAMRETVAGMYGSAYITNLAQLMIFAVAALVIGLVIRIPFMKINHFVEERMEDTGMM